MKKFVWLLILGLLLVPAYAAITVTTSASGSLSFKTRLLPTPVTFEPSASLTLNFDLSGDTKSVGNIVAVINAVSSPVFDGSAGTSGSLTFKNIGGLVDVSLNKETLTVSDAKLLGSGVSSANGIGVVVNAPFKVTAGYAPLSSDALSFTQGVLAGRIDGTVGPASVYALVSMSGGTTDFALGGSVSPVPMVSAFAEYASKAPNWIVGATVKPVAGVELYAHFKGDNSYKVSAKVTTVPNLTLYGEYTGTFYAWAKFTQSLPVGSVAVWGGYRTSDNAFAGYLKLDTPVGPATNTLRVFYNADVNDADGDGVIDEFVGTPLPNQLTIDNKISVSF